MAVLKIKDARAMSVDDLIKKLKELEKELVIDVENNSKRNKNIRKAIARIKTILNEKGVKEGGSIV